MKETFNGVSAATVAPNAPPAWHFADVHRMALPADDEADDAVNVGEVQNLADVETQPTTLVKHRYADIPFEVFTPTVDRQPIIVQRTVIVRETPQYWATPQPTYEAAPGADYSGIGQAVGEATGTVLKFAFEVTAGLFVGILCFLAQLLAALFQGSERSASSSYERPNLHKMPSKITQGGSTNTVRDININVHVGDNNRVNVKQS